MINNNKQSILNYNKKMRIKKQKKIKQKKQFIKLKLKANQKNKFNN